MTASIAAQSHCFRNWSFTNSILDAKPYNIKQYHTCVQRPLEAPNMPKSCEWSEHAGVGWFQSTSKRSPESSRRTACRNHADFQGAWKFGACWYSFGSALSADRVRTVLIFPNSHSDSCISVQTVSGLTSWPAVFSCFADASSRFCRSATNAAKRLRECVVWKKNTRQRCPILLGWV